MFFLTGLLNAGNRNFSLGQQLLSRSAVLVLPGHLLLLAFRFFVFTWRVKSSC